MGRPGVCGAGYVSMYGGGESHHADVHSPRQPTALRRIVRRAVRLKVGVEAALWHPLELEARPLGEREEGELLRGSGLVAQQHLSAMISLRS